ncbi:MAG: hypothetical protein JJ916_04410 [Phycisphaerales bacterium]|nr:hypothetical protein [Phycisphaerales bacterium]
MGNSSKDRQNPQNDRRKGGSGKPPPGTVVDRRLGIDRRNLTDPRTGEQANSDPTQEGFTGLERRRGRGRRLSEFTKSAEEGEMNTEQFLFLMAVDAFKKSNDRMFPTWTDVLEVIRLLGYRKTMPSELNLPAAEDWLERSDAPANVRPDRWAERFTETGAKAGGNEGPKKLTPKTEEELTDEALDAFEAAFGDEDFGEDFDSDLDSGYSDAA